MKRCCEYCYSLPEIKKEYCLKKEKYLVDFKDIRTRKDKMKTGYWIEIEDNGYYSTFKCVNCGTIINPSKKGLKYYEYCICGSKNIKNIENYMNKGE